MKLYVEEPGSSEVASEVERASGAATARVSYAEARAAFAHLRRERRLTNDLRAYDAIQLASALDLRRAGVELAFVSFDAKLNHAARRSRLRLLRV